MSNRWLTYVFERSPSRAGARLVALALADRADEDGRCWPAVADTARRAGLSEGQTRKLVRQLVDAGELRIIEHGGGVRPGGRAGRTNTYQLVRRDGDKAAGLETLAPATGLDNPETLAPARETLAPANTNPSAGACGTLAPARGEPSVEPTVEPSRNHQRRAELADPWNLAQKAMTGDILRTNGFRAAWASWVGCRRQAKKPLTPMTIERQIHKLEVFGHDRAIASINRSIENGWAGLFEPEPDRPGGRQVTGGLPKMHEDIQVRDFTR